MIDCNIRDSEISLLYSPAKAYWNQREKLILSKQRILKLYQIVDSSVDLSLPQWGQLFAFALDFSPDIILELGRGYGNSTCVFTEVANLIKPRSCEVLSLCKSSAWQRRTFPRLKRAVDKSWFAPLTALHTDILKFNFKQVLSNKSRVFVFWDAHGYDVAECVLGTILPEIAHKPHIVVMHDFVDTRYRSVQTGDYRLWRGGNSGYTRIRIGNIESAVEQAISIMDFATRNNLALHSADHSVRTELDKNRKTKLSQLLGNDLFSLDCCWVWFSLNEANIKYSFPIPYARKQEVQPYIILKEIVESILRYLPKGYSK